MEEQSRILSRAEAAFQALEHRVSRMHYKGYDPYDSLTGFLPWTKMGKWPPVLAIQWGKRFPINLRPLLGISKMQNPKALGLFLAGYAALPPTPETKTKCEKLFDRLMELRSPGFSGAGWGYPFPWAGPKKFLPAWSPTGVVTGFVAQGLEAYYNTYRDPRVPEVLSDICRFITEHLHHTDRGGIYAISYSTLEPDFCYNASLLSAQAYALTYRHTGETEYADRAARALTSVLGRQHAEGWWDYSEDLNTGKRRVQTDFHQGFILDSILSTSTCLGDRSPDVSQALHTGFDFYRRNQFAPNGRALWRLPKTYPADIHHQAQGLLTAVRMHGAGHPDAMSMALKTATYTLDHFRNSKGGFRYRIHKGFTDRTEYMRWGNAWVFVGLAELCRSLKAKKAKENPTEKLERDRMTA